ncbi:MAG: S8 family serine peptidase [Armatimonadota bacterium]
MIRYSGFKIRSFTTIAFSAILAALMVLPGWGAMQQPHRPNQLIVTLKSGAESSALKPFLSQYNGRIVKRLSAGNTYLVNVSQPATDITNPAKSSSAPSGSNIYTMSGVQAHAASNSINLMADKIMLNRAAVLTNHPAIKSVQYNNLYYINDIPTCEYYLPGEANPFKNGQWNLHSTEVPSITSNHIFAPQAWSMQKGSSGVVVAVLDSGIRTTSATSRAPHPDLAKRLLTGRNIITGSSDSSPSDLFSASGQAHGTHVAGIIATDISGGSKVAGLAWNGVYILPIRVFYDAEKDGDEPLTDDVAVANAIDYCINWAATVDSKELKVNVINLSLGGPGRSELLATKIAQATASGIVVVAASGNDYNYTDSGVSYPAAFPECISVGATDINDNIAAFSNQGQAMVDHGITAPGKDIPSTAFMTEKNWGDPKTAPENGNGYMAMSGTSMAAPHVAAAAALLISHGVPAGDVRPILLKTATERGDSQPNKVYGYGLMNVYKALLKASLEADIIYPSNGSTVSSSTTRIKINFRHVYKADDNKMFRVYLDGTPANNYTDGTLLIGPSSLSPAITNWGSYHHIIGEPKYGKSYLDFPYPVAAGAHTITVHAESDIAGITVPPVITTTTFTVQPVTLSKGWHMFSIPYKLDRSVTPDAWAGSNQCVLFRWSYAGGQSAEYKMYAINLSVGEKNQESSFFPPSVDAHKLVHPQSQVSTVTAPAGLGYWLYIYDDDGMPLPIITGDLVESEPYVIGLFNGWNMVGNPFTTQVNWSKALFRRANGEYVSYSQAISYGWIKDLIYRYDGASGQYMGSKLSSAVLAPWESQWILVRPSEASKWPEPDMWVTFLKPGT